MTRTSLRFLEAARLFGALTLNPLGVGGQYRIFALWNAVFPQLNILKGQRLTRFPHFPFSQPAPIAGRQSRSGLKNKYCKAPHGPNKIRQMNWTRVRPVRSPQTLGPMHVLVTTDTISGVWTYTRELVSGLVSRGLRVTLVSLGEVPLPEQTAWMDNLHGLDYRPTAFRLEWMHEGEHDYKDSAAYLKSLVEEIQPDVLHLNQFCYGDLPVDVPRVVVAHGDLITWWLAVHGHEPKSARWLHRYREAVVRGLLGATAVVLVGMQVPRHEMREFRRFLSELGYPYVDKS